MSSDVAYCYCSNPHQGHICRLRDPFRGCSPSSCIYAKSKVMQNTASSELMHPQAEQIRAAICSIPQLFLSDIKPTHSKTPLLSTHHGDTLKVYGQSLPGKHACAPKHVDILDDFAQLSLHLFICCQVRTYTYSACTL